MFYYSCVTLCHSYKVHNIYSFKQKLGSCRMLGGQMLEPAAIETPSALDTIDFIGT